MAFKSMDEFFSTFSEVFEAFDRQDFLQKIKENIKESEENINDNINIYIDNDDDMIIEIPAVGFEKEDVSVELQDNILIITAELDVENLKEVPDEKKLKTSFEYKNIIKKVKLSEKYVNGEFEVNVNKGLIFIIITPKEEKLKSRKIF